MIRTHSRMAFIAVATALFFVWLPIKVYAGSATESSSAPASSGNSTVVQSGKCGANITFTLYGDGLLELNGSGAMDKMCFIQYGKIDDIAEIDYSLPWGENSQLIESIVFNGAITSIGGGAFHDCSILKSYGCNQIIVLIVLIVTG